MQAQVDTPVELVAANSEHDVMKTFIHASAGLKPEQLIMSDLKWKYLVRSAMRGKNIMMTGPAGTGKTMAAKYLVSALERPDFYFNLGATQDPRATLIGNTHFSKEDGTYFAESLFVKAIQTENAVILLDELSRAHPEAWNILMTVLDLNQRYLRLDEKDGAPTIKVAPGVSFIATANVGNEYTSTRVMDRALQDRFITIEMDQLDEQMEFALLKMKYPAAHTEAVQAIAEIAAQTRKECKSSNPKLTNSLSTRAAVELTSLIYDGFSLTEAAEVGIYPFFSEDGGVDSERTYVKQIVQKYCVNPEESKSDLFGADDIAK
jgi:nitric oxide reductase NorQ protein